MIDFSASDFPSASGLKPFRWAPIEFSPILDLPERLVVGVSVIGENDFSIKHANSLERLRCLYPDHADEMGRFIVEAIRAFEQVVVSERANAIVDHEFVFLGIRLGKFQETEGFSAADVAQMWLQSVSSLHTNIQTFDLQAPDVVSERYYSNSVDRLPNLVWQCVQAQRPELEKYFSEDVRRGRARRSRLRAHEVQLDYSGSRVVANFGTLPVNSTVASIDTLKRRLWDLKINRDTQEGIMFQRKHELFVQHPAYNDPQVSARQSRSISQAVDELIRQADVESIRLRSFQKVDDMAAELLKHEAAT